MYKHDTNFIYIYIIYDNLITLSFSIWFPSLFFLFFFWKWILTDWSTVFLMMLLFYLLLCSPFSFPVIFRYDIFLIPMRPFVIYHSHSSSNTKTLYHWATPSLSFSLSLVLSINRADRSGGLYLLLFVFFSRMNFFCFVIYIN